MLDRQEGRLKGPTGRKLGGSLDRGLVEIQGGPKEAAG